VTDSPPFILRIAIPTPLRRSFDYLPPKGLTAPPPPGVRIRVPFGRGRVVGVLLETDTRSEVPRQRLRPALAVLDDEPVLDAELLLLLRWASAYYQHPIGEVIQQALPALLRQGQPARVPEAVRYRLADAGRTADEATLARAPRQRHLLAMLQAQPAGLDSAQLGALDFDWHGPMQRLVERGLVTRETDTALLPEPVASPVTGPEPNPEQQAAIDAVPDTGYHGFLLDGVTGSGKTEVYLRLIERTLAAGRQALVLVPEIGLTPQLLQRFRERLATPVAVLHSGLNDRERLRAWLAARAGEAGVIVGTRSALFTPLARPGLIVVDEEHDLSFKQQDGFRYSARDLALLRARNLDVPIVLGSATPSLESLENCARGRLTRLHLSGRAGGAVAPECRLLDVRSQKLQEGLSAQLLARMATHLEAGNQVMIFINRRGFAPVLMCHACGWHARCSRCDAHMTVHRRTNRLRCHHCGSERPLPAACPACGSGELIHMGYGTERVADFLAGRFPEVPVLRIDRDTTRRKGSLQALFERIHAGGAQILVGTQMLAKGHHFPALTLVGLLDADYGLFSADFRAAERLGQLVLQVAGRAGRAETPGEVLIQTHHPDSPLLRSLLRQDYGRFARALLDERRLAELPPFSHLALLRAEAVDPAAPLAFLARARELAEQQGHAGVELFGPMPSPMERRAGRTRAQLLLQADARAPLQALLGPWLQALETDKTGRRVRWSIDVDPLEMF